ncbi:MAG: CoA pyrophosphatase [Erysipelotrichaceae bacterium]|nr:CoA pyrophosphatase [Erysipelotrichaceae bacterium]
MKPERLCYNEKNGYSGTLCPHTGVSSGRLRVLLPLIEANGSWSVLFEVRSPAISQGGEVCFPGGKIENSESAEEAAVRETCEELLISPEQIGMLTPLPDRLSSPRKVYAFAAVLKEYSFTFSEEETERVFAIPLETLLKEEPLISDTDRPYRFPEDFPFELLPGGKNYPFRVRREPIYFYCMEESLIWGLTANILHTFLEIARSLK